VEAERGYHKMKSFGKQGELFSCAPFAPEGFTDREAVRRILGEMGEID
jgi:hypothetical protein